MCIVCYDLINQRIHHFFLSLFFSVGLSNTLCGSDVLLFLEFINAVFSLYYTFTEFMIFLYTFLVFVLLDTKNI